MNKFEVSRINYDYSIHYITENKEKRVLGYGDLSFQLMTEFKEKSVYPTDNLLNFCQKNQIDLNKKIAVIKTFYPNSMPQQICGGGTFLLNAMMEDAQKTKAALIYVLATTDSMDQFLRKKKFQECEKFRRQFFLVLKKS